MWPFTRKCKHDWERLEFCEWLKRGIYTGKYFLQEFENPYTVRVSRWVCLNCGEFRDGIAEASEAIHAQWDEEDQRKELAAKLWEECKGE